MYSAAHENTYLVGDMALLAHYNFVRSSLVLDVGEPPDVLLLIGRISATVATKLLERRGSPGNNAE